jgi:putative membrane protein
MELSIALLPALIHVYIFVLESLMWGKARTNKVFGVKDAEAQIIKPFAFNQGFYNLFLAVAVLLGLHLRTAEMTAAAGSVLIIYGLASMIAAGAVLVLSTPRLWRAALIQILPGIAGIIPYLR